MFPETTIYFLGLIVVLLIVCIVIDHMYFCAGGKPTMDTKILSGNFLQDISDHLANYTIICNTKSPSQLSIHLSEFSQKKINRNLQIT